MQIFATYHLAILALLSTGACSIGAKTLAATEQEDSEDEARIGYVTVNADGTSNFLINATSIQAFAIGSIVILIGVALLYPVIESLLFPEAEAGGGYATPETGYAEPANYYAPPASGYDGFSKRSLDTLMPIMADLWKGYMEYSQLNGDDETASEDEERR